jgi:hypothetical protein
MPVGAPEGWYGFEGIDVFLRGVRHIAKSLLVSPFPTNRRVRHKITGIRFIYLQTTNFSYIAIEVMEGFFPDRQPVFGVE